MSRNANPQPCRGCGAQILAGLSDDHLAHDAHVDPSPLSPYGEMLARLAGLRTYDLHREVDGFRLYVRDRWQIAGRPAGVLVYCWRVDVLTEHRCGWTFPTAPTLLITRIASTIDPTGPPPF